MTIYEQLRDRDRHLVSKRARRSVNQHVDSTGEKPKGTVEVPATLPDDDGTRFKRDVFDAIDRALAIFERDLGWRSAALDERVRELRDVEPVCHMPLPKLAKRSRNGWSVEFWLDVTEESTDVTAVIRDSDGKVSSQEVVAHRDRCAYLEDIFAAQKVAFTASGIEVSDKDGKLLATIATPGARLH